jgi:hypothetical protein
VTFTTSVVVNVTPRLSRPRARDVVHADAVIAALAGEQHGVVSYRQLTLAGLTRRQIERRLQSGHLLRMHRGVYAVGHAAVSGLARYAAALLAVGPHAVLSHRSAAVMWRILVPEEGAPVDVAIAAGQARHRPGIRIHRLKRLDIRHREGLRLTSPAQTLASLAASSSAATYERAHNEALAQRLIRSESSPGITRSELERKLRRIIEQSGLPTPRYNEPIAGREFDAVWHPQRYAVEVDSWQFHGHRKAFERDREKQHVANSAGYRLARVTDRQMDKPLQLVARLATALAS